MATSSETTTEQKIIDAVAFLREAGRDDEADAVESTLHPATLRRLRRSRPSPADADVVPIAEAAERLGMSVKAVQRRIEHGMLEGVHEQENGYQHVTRESLEDVLDMRRTLAVLAKFPFYQDDNADQTSNVARMIEEGLRRLAADDQ